MPYLSKFDEGMAAGLELALWEPLPDDSWTQATLAIDAGGLVMRETQAMALPAALACRVVSLPMVAEIIQIYRSLRPLHRHRLHAYL